jgi:hypothetical protein
MWASEILTWLDGSPGRFAFVSWGVFALAGAAALGASARTDRRRWWQRPMVFAALSLLSIMAFRWPMVLDNRELQDPDESQIMSGASKLAQDPFYWKSVDGDTRGPVNDIPLLALDKIGIHPDYTDVRFFGAVLAWACVMCAWVVFRHLFGDGWARILVLPILGVHAFSDFWNFVQYGSEQVTDALIALSCALLVTSFGPSERFPNRRRLLLLGIALGLVPFAKLQGAPIAAWIGLCAAWQIATAAAAGPRVRARCLLALFGGVAAVFALILLWVICGGAWRDFYGSYVLENLRYAGARWFSWDQMPSRLYELSGMAPGSKPFLFWSAALSTLGLIAFLKFSRTNRNHAAFALGLTAVAVLAAMAPGRMFPHYLQLTFFPVGLLCGVVTGASIAFVRQRVKVQPTTARVLQGAVVASFLAISLGPQINWRRHETQPSLGQYNRTHGHLQRTAVAQAILSHAHSGERLGIWGWGPKFWVQTGLLQATRDGDTSRQLDLTSSRSSYRERYMRDLMESRPPVFIDAVGKGNFEFNDRYESGHETFGDLNDFIKVNYREVGDVDGTRIYVRNDRS